MKNYLRVHYLNLYSIILLSVILIMACNNVNDNENKADLGGKNPPKVSDNLEGNEHQNIETAEPKVNNKAMMALLEKAKMKNGNAVVNKEIASDGRPKTVPASAIFVGEKGRGAYIKLSASKSDFNRFFGEIYLESGKLHYKGPLEVKPSTGQQFEFNNPESYSYFDGDNLVLKDGRVISGIRIF